MTYYYSAVKESPAKLANAPAVFMRCQSATATATATTAANRLGLLSLPHPLALALARHLFPLSLSLLLLFALIAYRASRCVYCAYILLIAKA